MDSNIDIILRKNIEYIEILINIADEQKKAIEKKDFPSFMTLDKQKFIILKKLENNNNILESNDIKNKKDYIFIQNNVQKINLLLNKLIKIERDNATQISDLLSLFLGKHIQSYKKIMK